MAATDAFGPLLLVAQPDVPGTTLWELVVTLNEHDVDTQVLSPKRGEVGRVVRNALDAGTRYLAAVGDDTIVHATVNALFDAEGRPLAPDVVFAVVTGPQTSDFAKTFGLDRDPLVLARHLASTAVMPVDVGVAEYTDVRGRRARRLFANGVEVGYGADLIRRARRLRRLGNLGRLLAAYGAIRGAKRPETDVAVAGQTVRVPLTSLVAANGQFLARGQKIAPRALPDDGRLNVLLFTGPRSQVFTLTQPLRKGEHLPNAEIYEYQSETLTLAPPTPLDVALDGQFVGRTPARFSLLPGALRLKI